MIRVQAEDFDIGAEIAALTAGRTHIGGVVTFTGLVRDFAEGAAISTMTLEHYPGMTERMLEGIEAEANRRWPLDASLIVHRYGPLEPGESHVGGMLKENDGTDSAMDWEEFGASGIGDSGNMGVGDAETTVAIYSRRQKGRHVVF